VRVEIIKEQRLLDGYIKVEEATLKHEKFDGTLSEELQRSAVIRVDAVVAVVYNPHRDRLIFVKQFRYPLFKRDQEPILELVAGVVDPGESPEQTLIRELKEEIGASGAKIQPFAQVFASPGYSTEMLNMFYVEVEGSEPPNPTGGLEAEGEDLQVVELTPTEATERIDQGTFQDAKTLLGVLWFLRQSRIGP
jgi:ADP-ribose pyrophosphatase